MDSRETARRYVSLEFFLRMARATGFKFNTLIDQVGVIRKMKFIPKRGMV